VHVPDEGTERVGFLVGRLVGLRRGAPQGVEDDGAHERAPLGEPPVEGGDPDPCSPGNLIEGGPGTVLDEQVTRSVEQALPVVASVGAQWPWQWLWLWPWLIGVSGLWHLAPGRN
jgi:hypothetical protein